MMTDTSRNNVNIFGFGQGRAQALAQAEDALKSYCVACIHLVGDLERFELKPTDVLVLSTDQELAEAHKGRICELMRRLAPGHEVLVLDQGTKLSIMGRPEENRGRRNKSSFFNEGAAS